MEAAVETQQPQTTESPAAPVVQSVETSAQPEKVGTEGTETKVETEETPQKRESRRARQLNRERERRIAAETELRLYREQQQVKQQPKVESSDEPRRDQYEDYETFIKAQARYEARLEAREEAKRAFEESRKKDSEISQRESQEKAAREWHTKVEKARDLIDDFDEVCSESESIVLEPAANAMRESDQGALIAYYLAKNPDEAERISKLSPSKQAAAIVNLEDKVSKPAKKLSKAPDPINPVGTKVEVTKDPAKMSQAEYNAWRDKGGK